MSVGGRMSTVTAMANVDLPSSVFRPIRRAGTPTDGGQRSVLAALIPPDTPVTVQVGETAIERIETPKETIDTKRTRVTARLCLARPLTRTPERSRRSRPISVPAQALEVLREDLSSVATRQVTISRSNDEQVRIPSIGFTLAGTISKPAGPAGGRVPAVVLVGGDGQTDRDEIIAGVPILGQLANASQMQDSSPCGTTSAGWAGRRRAESAALKLRRRCPHGGCAIRAPRGPKRIVVIGHGQGGAVAAGRCEGRTDLTVGLSPPTDPVDLSSSSSMRSIDHRSPTTNRPGSICRNGSTTP